MKSLQTILFLLITSQICYSTPPGEQVHNPIKTATNTDIKINIDDSDIITEDDTNNTVLENRNPKNQLRTNIPPQEVNQTPENKSEEAKQITQTQEEQIFEEYSTHLPNSTINQQNQDISQKKVDSKTQINKITIQEEENQDYKQNEVPERVTQLDTKPSKTTETSKLQIQDAPKKIADPVTQTKLINSQFDKPAQVKQDNVVPQQKQPGDDILEQQSLDDLKKKYLGASDFCTPQDQQSCTQTTYSDLE